MFLKRSPDDSDDSPGLEFDDDGTSAASQPMTVDDSDLRATTVIQTTTVSLPPSSSSTLLTTWTSSSSSVDDSVTEITTAAASSSSLLTITTVPAAVVPAEESTAPSATNFDDDTSTFVNFSDRVAAGITIGAIVGAFVLAAVIFAFWRHHSRPWRHAITAHNNKNNKTNNSDKDDDEKPSGKLPSGGGGDDSGESPTTTTNNNNQGLSLDDTTTQRHQHQQLHFRIIELPANEITELGGNSSRTAGRSLALVHGAAATVRHLSYPIAADTRGWDWHHHWYGMHNLRPYARELWAGDMGLVGAVVHEMHAPDDKTTTRAPPTELSAVMYLPDDGSGSSSSGGGGGGSSRKDVGGLAAVRLGRPLTLRRTRTTAVMEGLGGGLVTPLVVVESPPSSPVSQQGTVLSEVSPTGSTRTAAEELVSPLSPRSQTSAIGWFSF